jgi:Beta-lactamase enzyme family
VIVVSGVIVACLVVAGVAGYWLEADRSGPVAAARKGSALTTDRTPPGASSTATPNSNGSRSATTTTSPTTKTTAPASTTTTTDPDGATGVLASTSIAQFLAGRAGDVTAEVLDLRTGQLSQWRPGIAEDTASIVKVDILATLLHQLQSSGASLTSTQQWLCQTMIEESDNNSASALWNEVGQNTGVARFNALVGLTDTTPGTDGEWGLTTTTALDQVRLLRDVVVPNDTLTTASRDYELSLMEDIDSGENWGVSYGPPTGTTVALKNGWLPQQGWTDWQINSIGWINGDGRDYLVAILTSGNNTEDYGINTIQGLSSLIWTQLGSRVATGTASRAPSGGQAPR